MQGLVRQLLAAAVLCVSAAVVPAATANVVGDSQGCTPGYWKARRHLDSWQEAAPTDRFAALYGMTSKPQGLATDLTMLGALQGKGGAGLEGARRILARSAAAAYLNAAYDTEDATGLLYPYRRQELGYNGEAALVPTVTLTLTYGSRDVILELAAQLDAANSLGCPLS